MAKHNKCRTISCLDVSARKIADIHEIFKKDFENKKGLRNMGSVDINQRSDAENPSLNGILANVVENVNIYEECERYN